MDGVAATMAVDWNAVADRFCAAWTSEAGKPDFDTLSAMYAPDDDTVIYDSLPPLEGFRGFSDLRASIYGDLAELKVVRTGDVIARRLAEGAVVVTAYPMRFHYRFANGRTHDFDARISEVWERRGNRYVIVHEHPSTTLEDGGDQAEVPSLADLSG